MRRLSAIAGDAARRSAEAAAARLVARADQAFAAGEYAPAERDARAALVWLGERAAGSVIGCAAARSLGTTLRVFARYREAEALLQRALQWSRSLGPLERAASQNALAMLFKYTGRHAEAARLYRAALAAFAARFGVGDRRLAPILHNLGGIEHARRRFARGEAYARRGLAIRRSVRARDDLAIAQDEVALGALLEGQDRLVEAARLYRRALRVYERVLGRAHYEVAVVCNNLGSLSYARGCFVDAQTYYRRSLRIKRRVLGDGHPDVALTHNNLAVLTRALGQPDAARALYERALAVFARAYGPRHPMTRLCRANLARLGAPAGPQPKARRTDRSRRTRGLPSRPARRRA